jgi:hypothetical protein
MRPFYSMVVLVSGLLAACEAHTPGAIVFDSDAALRQEDALQLCLTYHLAGQQRIREELNRRQALSVEEWALVDAKRIGIGMSRCALLASWGIPEGTRRQVTAAGQSLQYIYPGRRIYLENDRIAAFKAVD